MASVRLANVVARARRNEKVKVTIMAKNTPITVAYGEGIGPEIMDATLHIIQAAGARIEIEPIEAGAKVYLRGINAGIEPSAWESLRRTTVFLHAPIPTPQSAAYT